MRACVCVREVDMLLACIPRKKGRDQQKIAKGRKKRNEKKLWMEGGKEGRKGRQGNNGNCQKNQRQIAKERKDR